MTLEQSLGERLADVSREYLAGADDIDARRERYLDTLSLVLVQMLETLDTSRLTNDERRLFEIALARTGLNDTVRSRADVERLLGYFVKEHPPDEELLAKLAEVTGAR